MMKIYDTCLNCGLYYANVCDFPDGDAACRGSSNLSGHRKAPLLKAAEVLFPNICEECYFKEEAKEHLGGEVCFISKELTFSVTSVGHIYH